MNDTCKQDALLPNAKRAYYTKVMRRAIKDGTLTDRQLSQLESIEFKTTPQGGGHKERAVICVETGERFKSITEATIWLGLTPDKTGYISRAAKRGCAAKGFHWQYEDCDTPSSCKSNARPVLCVETGKVYESQSAAARELGIAHGQPNISAAILSGKPWSGCHWTYADGKGPDDTCEKRSTAKAVRCIETGKIYPSLAAASRYANVCASGGCIQRAANTGGTSGGYHWQYADEAPQE